MRFLDKNTLDSALTFALVLTGLVVVGHIAAYPAPVRDIIHGHLVEGLTVQYPAIYILLAPVFQLADRITILSARQLFIVLTYINAAWLAWRIAACSRRNASIRAIPAEIIRIIGINAFVLLFIFLVILVPRPLPTLRVADPDIVVLDFHTHTNHSWDGRPSASLLQQIRRRQSGGFNAFFITDHNNRYSALDTEDIKAAKEMDLRAIPLRGEEISSRNFNLVVLGPKVEYNDNRGIKLERDQNLLLDDELNPQTLVIATADARWWKQPELLDSLVQAGLDGIELAKASPMGLDLTVEDRRRMVDYALRNGLIITGASDNHGYGYTDYVWNLLRLPGWRTMDPRELERAVLGEMRLHGPDALTIVTRIKAEPTNSFILMAIDPIRQVWEMVRSLPTSQAYAFILLAWSPFALRLMRLVLWTPPVERKVLRFALPPYLRWNLKDQFNTSKDGS